MTMKERYAAREQKVLASKTYSMLNAACKVTVTVAEKVTDRGLNLGCDLAVVVANNAITTKVVTEVKAAAEVVNEWSQQYDSTHPVVKA